MNFFKNMFGKKAEPESEIPELKWVEASENALDIRLLDLRPITQNVTSTSKNPDCARNAISFIGDDGLEFADQIPDQATEIEADISFPVDPFLAPGVLYAPTEMEQKWAIFFYNERIIFVRSWLRKISVTAEAEQENGVLRIVRIKGQFSENENPDFTRRITKFLLVSHNLQQIYPAPLPNDLSTEPKAAGLWAMSIFGNMAVLGTPDPDFDHTIQDPLRSNSLLHISAARNDLSGLKKQIEKGIPLGLIAQDGQAPLHWSILARDPGAMQMLIEAGTDTNIRSVFGETPVMTAAENNRVDHLNLLIDSGVEINHCNDDGFTALHKAAEGGFSEIVEILLKNDADRSVEAAGYTPLKLAELQNNTEIVNMLKD